MSHHADPAQEGASQCGSVQAGSEWLNSSATRSAAELRLSTKAQSALPNVALVALATPARPHILLAWEHGRNLGHLVRLAEIAGLIHAREGRVTWAVPPQYIEHSMLGQRNEPILMAPVLAQPAPDRSSARGRSASQRLYSFADVLLALGFQDAQTVQIKLIQWLRLLEAVRPTALLCDYAPFALLAACILGIPATQITNGFDAPPADFPLFDSAVRGPYLERLNAQKIEQLEQTVSRVSRTLGAPGLRLADFMAWPSVVIDGIAETDPYGPRSRAIYIGPFMRNEAVHEPYWPMQQHGETGKRVFVYLRGKQTVPVLEALSSLGHSTCCLWPDASKYELSRFRGPRVQITREPLHLQMALSYADAVINYGSSGVLSATLLAGKPQLMLPTDREKLMFSHRVVRQGAGITQHMGQSDLRPSIDQLLSDAALAVSAQQIASRYSAHQLDHQREVFLDQLLHGARPAATQERP